MEEATAFCHRQTPAPLRAFCCFSCLPSVPQAGLSLSCLSFTFAHELILISLLPCFLSDGFSFRPSAFPFLLLQN